MWHVRVTIVFVKKRKRFTYSERLSLALFIQHAMRMRRIIVSFVACLAVPYVSTLSHKRHDFQKALLNINEFLCKFCPKIFLNPRRSRIDIVINLQALACKFPVYVVRLDRNFHFLDIFEKYSNIKFHENPSCSM